MAQGYIVCKWNLQPFLEFMNIIFQAEIFVVRKPTAGTTYYSKITAFLAPHWPNR